MSASSILSIEDNHTPLVNGNDDNDNDLQEFRGNGIEHTEEKYDDGSIYKGTIDKAFGNRTGFGVLRSPITMFGAYDSQNPNTLLHWTEYAGQWLNDKEHGFGIMRRCRGDGTTSIIFEGMWENGEPLEDRAEFFAAGGGGCS
jgi:hypothetical protein